MTDAIHSSCTVIVTISIWEGMLNGEEWASLFFKVNALLRMITLSLIMEYILKLFPLILLLPLKCFLNFVTVYGGDFRTWGIYISYFNFIYSFGYNHHHHLLCISQYTWPRPSNKYLPWRGYVLHSHSYYGPCPFCSSHWKHAGNQTITWAFKFTYGRTEQYWTTFCVIMKLDRHIFNQCQFVLMKWGSKDVTLSNGCIIDCFLQN